MTRRENKEEEEEDGPPPSDESAPGGEEWSTEDDIPREAVSDVQKRVQWFHSQAEPCTLSPKP
jgi:hypothetical protein